MVLVYFLFNWNIYDYCFLQYIFKKIFYTDIKNNYSKDDKYLAVVTGNGLWIRDEIKENTNYVNANKIDNNNLINVSISQFDKNFNLKKNNFNLIIDIKKFMVI